MKTTRGILWRYLRAYKVQYLLGLLILLGVDYANLLVPQITGEIADGLAAATLDERGIMRFVMWLIAVALAVTIGRMLWRFFIFGASRQIERELRNDLFAKLEELSASYFNTHKTGDLMTHFVNDLEALRNSIGPAIIASFDAVVMTLMVLYQMMMQVDGKLTLLTLIPMLAIAGGGYYFGQEFERRFAQKQESFAKMSDHIQESISGERVIKAFVQEEKQDAAFRLINLSHRKINLRVVKLMAAFMPLLDFIIGLSFGIPLVYGGYLTIIGQISLGSFIAFHQYLGLLIWPMIALGDSITAFSQGRSALVRIRKVFAEQATICDASDPYEIQELKGAITFSHVQFAYGEGLPNVLDDISFQIHPGETLAVLGHTGAGKTTLANLMLRLYDINEGTIAFDGYELKRIPLSLLRQSIAYVPQDSFLFSDTLAQNITFGKQNASMEEIQSACRIACVHDNIMEFGQGYETMVGERGVTLSGGQKQRCAIARALLKDAPILILDDSLSAVDTDTEDRILTHLKHIRANKTTLMIAHRISSVKHADHIMVLKQGSIAEYGTFGELMAQKGIFWEMYQKQQLEQQLAQHEEVSYGPDHERNQ
ncbi:MAG: ABC transporter ATP-binding protein [Erysipelotrichaceae bacterium]|nr:ABC transporter ATP-binding protein [Erysipelotrichaceae bacterium]